MKTLNDLLGDEGEATVLRQRCEELAQDKADLLRQNAALRLEIEKEVQRTADAYSAQLHLQKKVRDMGAEIETLKAGMESLRSERDMAHAALPEWFDPAEIARLRALVVSDKRESAQQRAEVDRLKAHLETDRDGFKKWWEDSQKQLKLAESDREALRALLQHTKKELAECNCALAGLLEECRKGVCFESVSFDHPDVKPAFDAAHAAVGRKGFSFECGAK